MSDYFEYNGVNSSTFLARVFPTDSMLKSSARDYTTVSVPGRSGTLLLDHGSYANIMREYDVQIVGDTDLAKFNALRAHLASCVGYLRLTDSFEPAHYFMAAYTEGFNMTADFASKRRGRGTITFECKPQRFLISGETAQTFTSSSMITNPTQFQSKPLLRVYGHGILGIGSTNITIAAHSGSYMDIDCETGRAYYGATPLDSYVSLNTIDYPTLPAGVTGVALSGVTRVIITPRWWEL